MYHLKEEQALVFHQVKSTSNQIERANTTCYNKHQAAVIQFMVRVTVLVIADKFSP